MTLQGARLTGPHQHAARIRLPVGTELRIRTDGEVSVGEPAVSGTAIQGPESIVLEYHFDVQTAQHVLRWLPPRLQNE